MWDVRFETVVRRRATVLSLLTIIDNGNLGYCAGQNKRGDLASSLLDILDISLPAASSWPERPTLEVHAFQHGPTHALHYRLSAVAR